MTERQKGVVALVALSFVFATMGIYARYLQTDFALLQQIYLRLFGAALLGTALFFGGISFKKLGSITKKDWVVVIFRAVTFAVGVTLFTLAFLTTKYSDATFVAAIPLLPLLGYLFLKEKITGKVLFYVLLGFVGVAIIAIHDFSHVFNWGRGELYAFLSAIAFDFSYVARRKQTPLLNDRESTVLIFFIEALLVFVASFFFGESLPAASAFTLGSIVVLVIASLANVANLFLVNYGFGRVEAAIAGNILTLETVFALLFGIFIYAEVPSLREIAGGLIIVFSVYQINKLETAPNK